MNEFADLHDSVQVLLSDADEKAGDDLTGINPRSNALVLVLMK